MTSKDKTREKLMGSMRKTKADAGIGGGQNHSDSTARQAAPEPAKPAAIKVKQTTPSSKPRTTSNDGYQSGRRVWPD